MNVDVDFRNRKLYWGLAGFVMVLYLYYINVLSVSLTYTGNDFMNFLLFPVVISILVYLPIHFSDEL